jgi:hypothetical protein
MIAFKDWATAGTKSQNSATAPSERCLAVPLRARVACPPPIEVGLPVKSLNPPDGFGVVHLPEVPLSG